MSYSPMQLADAFLKTGELDDALEALNQQLEAFPQDDDARRLRIQVYLRQMSDEAIASIRADSEQLTTKRADDWHRLSILEERCGQIDAAIEAMQKARQLAPDEARLTERIVALYLQKGEPAAALDIIRQQERTWQWLEREGDVLVLLGDDMLATARYGLVLAQLGELEGVMREDYLRALKLRVVLARAHAYRRAGHLETAREHYTAAQTIVADPTIQFNLGLIAALEGSQDEALRLCREALAGVAPGLRASMLDSMVDDAHFAELQDALTRTG